MPTYKEREIDRYLYIYIYIERERERERGHMQKTKRQFCMRKERDS